MICVTGPTQNPSRSPTYASRPTRALLTSRLRVSCEAAFGARRRLVSVRWRSVQNEENAMNKQDLLQAVASQTRKHQGGGRRDAHRSVGDDHEKR